MTDADRWLAEWDVRPTAAPLRTASSLIVLGERDGRPVVLKVAPVEEERRGARLLAWWAGRGAVAVLERDGDAVLLERATGTRDLAALARDGRDAEATAVLARVAMRLHANGVPDPGAGVGLLPLRIWFRDLVDGPRTDPLLARCADVAREALAATRPEDVVALHGDIHHGNVLDTGEDWAAIDPKGLVGHRAFDLGNLFCNPGGVDPAALLPERLEVVAAETGLDRDELGAWIVAWCGLSAVWTGLAAARAPGDPTWSDQAHRAVAGRLLGVSG